MPLDSGWIDDALGALEGEERAVARLAIVLAKASYRVTDADGAWTCSARSGMRRDSSAFLPGRHSRRRGAFAEVVAVRAGELDVREKEGGCRLREYALALGRPTHPLAASYGNWRRRPSH